MFNFILMKKKEIAAISNKSWIDGFNYVRKNEFMNIYEKEYERGRISLNEYRRLAYDLPPIEHSASIQTITREEHSELHGHPGLGV